MQNNSKTASECYTINRVYRSVLTPEELIRRIVQAHNQIINNIKKEGIEKKGFGV